MGTVCLELDDYDHIVVNDPRADNPSIAYATSDFITDHPEMAQEILALPFNVRASLRNYPGVTVFRTRDMNLHTGEYRMRGVGDVGGTGPLQLGEPVVDQRGTEGLRAMKRLPARRSDSMLSTAIVSAAAHAKKYKVLTYVYQGNSYMHLVWHVTTELSKVRSRGHNTGAVVFEVTPDLQLLRRDVLNQGFGPK